MSPSTSALACSVSVISRSGRASVAVGAPPLPPPQAARRAIGRITAIGRKGLIYFSSLRKFVLHALQNNPRSEPSTPVSAASTCARIPPKPGTIPRSAAAGMLFPEQIACCLRRVLTRPRARRGIVPVQACEPSDSGIPALFPRNSG